MFRCSIRWLKGGEVTWVDKRGGETRKRVTKRELWENIYLESTAEPGTYNLIQKRGRGVDRIYGVREGEGIEILTPELSELFECPSCGSHRLEEIMSDVTVSSVVNSIGPGGDVDYGEQSNEGGVVDRYQCVDCGYVLQDDGNNITDSQELWEHLTNPQRECKPGCYKARKK